MTPLDFNRERRIKRIVGEMKELFDHTPGLQERTGELLRGELPCPDLEEELPTKDENLTSIRLPIAFQERADALIPKLKNNPEIAAFGRVTRSAVIRLAIAKGLEQLEREEK